MPDMAWDDDNRGHIARHGITPAEFEEAFASASFDLDYREVDGEIRFSSIGETARGRILIVVVMERDRQVRPVTAFEPGKQLLNLYLQSREPHG